MPTYDYECAKCGQEFEVFQSMNDAPLKKCPKCGKVGVRRKVGSGAGLIFKGTGFYITDYKKKSGAPEPTAASAAKPAATEAKPAAAAPAKPVVEKKSRSKSAAK